MTATVITDPITAALMDSYQGAHLKGPFPLKPELTEQSLLEAYLWIWQELLCHDEVVRAKRFLEACPWRIRHRMEIAKAWETTVKVSAHLDSDSTYFCFYEGRAVQNPGLSNCNEDELGVHAGRWRAVLEAASSLPPKSTVLDLGCQDGWMSALLAKRGLKVLGVDLVPGLVELARETHTPGRGGKRIGRDGSLEFLTGIPKDAQYDLVVCCEVWEHARDDEALYHTLLGCARGLVVVTTPEGSWYRGRPILNAPPWYVPREHVRAVTCRELVVRFSADFDIVKAWVEPAEAPEVPGQATAILIARKR